jgi:polysaccharide pyruvyl transferase CsaB
MGCPAIGEAKGRGLRLVVAGYYGCGNLGDDALLLGLLNELGGMHEVTALSGDPPATEAAFGIRAVARKDLKQVTAAIKSADALVFGGGGLLQDTTSLLSLKYYTHLIETASRAGKAIALLGQGIGPINTLLGKRAAARAFGQCDVIATRDEGSMRIVDKLAPDTRAHKAVTDDLAWLAIGNPSEAPRRHAIAISARPWKNVDGRVVSAFNGFVQRAEADGWEILPVSFDRGMDDGILEQIAPGSSYASTPQEALKALEPVQTTVAMRLHAGIFSAGLGIVPTMVSYDAKVTAFAESFGGTPITVEALSADSLWDAFISSQEHAARLEPAVRERAEVGANRARINVRLLEESLARRT